MILTKDSIHIVPALIICALIIIISYFFNKFLQKTIIKLSEKHKLAVQITRALEILAQYFIISVAIILILENLHVQISALFGTFGIIAVGIGFALQNALADMTSGILILYYKPFFVGNYIYFTSNELKQSIEGMVTDINLRYTELEFKGNKILVPNNLVYRSGITIQNNKENNSTQTTKENRDL